jgi:hypothetical protein
MYVQLMNEQNTLLNEYPVVKRRRVVAGLRTKNAPDGSSARGGTSGVGGSGRVRLL